MTKEEISGSGPLSIDSSLEMISRSLLPKINAFRKVIGNSRISDTSIQVDNVRTLKSIDQTANESFMDQMPIAPKMILLGCSTGGGSTY